MKCEQYSEWMSERLDGALDAQRSATLDQHLEACSGCREEWRLLSESWNLLGELPELEPSATFRAEVWEKIRQTPGTVGGWQWVRRLLLPLAATGACLTLALGLWGGPRGPVPQATPLVANTVPDKEIPQTAMQDWEPRLEVIPDPMVLAEEQDAPLEPVPLGDLSHDYLASSETAFEEALKGL